MATLAIALAQSQHRAQQQQSQQTQANTIAPSSAATGVVASPTAPSAAITSSSSASSSRVARPSLTPSETLASASLSALLTPFEQAEILEFPNIYFLGTSQLIKHHAIPHTPQNNGYDDERGDYKCVMGDHLEYRYEIISVLGRGSFGCVLKCFDHKKSMCVALKIIRNKKRFHHQALIEVKILEHLMSVDREHKSHIVRVHGYFYFRNHLCITFEPLSINLYEFLKSNHFRGISLGLIRRFAVQLLHSLHFLHSHRIIHCDLKPENILLKSSQKSTIKLIDFGSSCYEDERIYTYIQSRFYRSPEVLLGLPYSTAIDMWSLGCILCELYTGYPLFPGENEHEQLLCLMEVLGPPNRKMIEASTRKKLFFDLITLKPLPFTNSRGKQRTVGAKDLATVTRCADPNFISFLRKLLRWDPQHRMTAAKAFEHAFIKEETHNATNNTSTTSPTSTIPTPLVTSSAASPNVQTTANTNTNAAAAKVAMTQSQSHSSSTSSSVSASAPAPVIVPSQPTHPASGTSASAVARTSLNGLSTAASIANTATSLVAPANTETSRSSPTASPQPPPYHHDIPTEETQRKSDTTTNNASTAPTKRRNSVAELIRKYNQIAATDNALADNTNSDESALHDAAAATAATSKLDTRGSESEAHSPIQLAIHY